MRPPHRLGRLAADMVNAARKNPACALTSRGRLRHLLRLRLRDYDA
jgi:hypothetical protein